MIPDALAEFLGQGAEDQIQSGNYKTGTDGKYKPGIMDHFWNRADDGQKYLDRQKQTQIETPAKTKIQALNGTFVPGKTEGEYNNDIYRLQQQRNNDAYTNSPAGKAADRTEKRLDNQFTIQNKRLDNAENERRLERIDARKDRLQDRIDAREARADDLMFRRESMERADRRDEKNRRRESIQALVAGLSSLGAAFAV